MALPFMGKKEEVLVDVGAMSQAAEKAAAQSTESLKLQANEKTEEYASNKDSKDASNSSFYIDLTPKRVSLPVLDDPKKINVRYPLIPPFAFAHIFWDDKKKEILYFADNGFLIRNYLKNFIYN